MEQIELFIRNLGSNGEGIGSYHGLTVFVEGALPGETVRAELVEKKKNYGRANLLAILKPSPDRIEPICPLFGSCGGCQLMHLPYDKQLQYKRQLVLDALKRIGKIENPPVEDCLPSPLPLGYRNKIQLPAKQSEKGISLGLYARGSHQLIEVEECFIHCPLGEQIFKTLRELLSKSRLQAYNPATCEGELRHVLIRSAVNQQEALVIFVSARPPSEEIKELAQALIAKCPAVKGVSHNLNDRAGNAILGRTYETLAGMGFISEKLGSLMFKVSPASFFQVNPLQAERLYAKAVQMAALDGTETVLDAYCGVGTLSLFFAQKAKKVVGVECVAEAIADAKENALLNHISNASFVCAASEAYIQTLKHVDVALLNPPRKGCDPEMIKGLIKLQPKKIFYISCNPATLARDLAMLIANGFQLESAQPFDMFPQTAHVECLAALSYAR